MKQIILSLLLLLTFSVHSQKPSDYNQIVINEPTITHKFQVPQQKLEVKEKDELIYHWYKSNALHTSRGGYDGAILHGTYTAYYLNNNLKEKGEFKEGLKIGEWKNWHENGELKQVEHYKKGNKIGLFTQFDTTGKLQVEAAYKKGVLHGKHKTYENGKLANLIEYKNGLEKTAKTKKEPEVKNNDAEPVPQTKTKKSKADKDKKPIKIWPFRKKEKTDKPSDSPKEKKKKESDKSPKKA